MLLAWVQQRDYLSEEIPFMKKASRCMGDDRAAEESSIHVSGTHYYAKTVFTFMHVC